MAHVRGEITIDRPVETVFDVVADERNEPRYNPGLLKAEKLTDGPVGAGTRFHAVHRGRRRPVDLDVGLTEYDRPRRLGSVSTTPTFEARGALTFEQVAGGTRMRWDWEIRPTGALRLLGPLVGVVGRRQERACWEGLKRYCEDDVSA